MVIEKERRKETFEISIKKNRKFMNRKK